MNKPICSHHKADGTPCRAPALAGRPFCYFHDPQHAAVLAAGRRKGGAAPRRRVRRYPRRLRQGDVAEVLSEILIAALNHPEAMPDDRLRALTRLAETLLREPGAHSALSSDSRHSSPSPAGHLLRIYAPAGSPDPARPASKAQPACPRPALSPGAPPAEQRVDSTCTAPSRTADSLPPPVSRPSQITSLDANSPCPEPADRPNRSTPTQDGTPNPTRTPLALPLAEQGTDSTCTAPSAVEQKTLPCRPNDARQALAPEPSEPSKPDPSVPPPCPPRLRGEKPPPAPPSGLTAAPPSPPAAAPAPPCRSRSAAPATGAPPGHRRRPVSRPARRSRRPQ